jgi:diguanylate cyclase (GGDEF)-like protein
MTDTKIMPFRTTSVLLIEDNESDIFVIENALHTTFPDEFKLTLARSVEEAVPMLTQAFDVAILDWSLPGPSGLEALKILTKLAPKLAIVVLTGNDNETDAFIALKQGAQDYLTKEHVDQHLIKRSIRYAIERKYFEGNLITMANYDALTGLANRSLFESRLDMALARSRRSGEPVGTLFLDLNGFKQVNDTFGHENGDTLLKEVGARLIKTLRECDTVARFGGDEFAVLIEDAASPQHYAIVAQKIIDALTPPFILNGTNVEIGISIGIAIGTLNMEADTLMKQADEAMYRAKECGTSNYQFYNNDINSETLEKMQMEHELTISIRRKAGLCLLYQPKLETSGQLVGAEVLLRWDHPRRGTLAPADFLHLLVPAMAIELDQWVLETVCRDICCWQMAGLKPTQISLTVSNQRWENTDTTEILLNVIRRSGLTIDGMSVMIDDMAMRHYGSAEYDVLSRLRETNLEIRLSDSEGEVSSLRLRTRCPLDAAKIDHASADHKGQHPAMVNALVALGENLGSRTLGGDIAKQKEIAQGTDSGQAEDVIISKPLSAPEFFHWLGNRQQLAS